MDCVNEENNNDARNKRKLRAETTTAKKAQRTQEIEGAMKIQCNIIYNFVTAKAKLMKPIDSSC